MQKAFSPGAVGIRGLDLAEQIALTAKAGFDSLIFDVREAAALADRRGADEVKGLFARAGVAPGGWGLPVAWQNDHQWRDDLRDLPRLAALGRALGSDRVFTWVPPGSNERAEAENFAWHVERFRPIAEVLGAEGCRLGLEFIGPKTSRARFTHAFIYTMDGMLELARTISTGNVGLLLDAWHVYTAGGSMTDLDRLTAADVVVAHVNDAPPGLPIEEQNDHIRALPGETGVIDLAGFMSRLSQMGYVGPVMPEPFSARLNQRAPTDPEGVARETAASMDWLWRAGGLA